MSNPITLLAIETSCDETGVAVLQKDGDAIKVLSNTLASQSDIHALSGGVIPEVAAREHVTAIQLLVPQALKESGVAPEELHAIAVTVGPGLQPALTIGVNAARALSFCWEKPLVPIHHLEGHIYSALLQGKPVFPAMALLVSGGHTQLVLVSNHLEYNIIGRTVDDAAGEAFDKVARLLGLPYPGGPALSKLAATGNRAAHDFPRPMMHSGDLQFSFSGLKTAVLYAWQKVAQKTDSARADIAASFEQAVIDTLVGKTKQAIIQTQPKVVLLAGGVAANSLLRSELKKVAQELGIELRISPLELCGDNAVMIGQAGLFAYEQGRTAVWKTLDSAARLDLNFAARS